APLRGEFANRGTRPLRALLWGAMIGDTGVTVDAEAGDRVQWEAGRARVTVQPGDAFALLLHSRVGGVLQAHLEAPGAAPLDDARDVSAAPYGLRLAGAGWQVDTSGS